MSVKPVDQLMTLSNPPSGGGDADAKALRDWLMTMTTQINDMLFDYGYAINQLAIGNLPYAQLSKLTAAPASPQPGWVVYADGVNWNPGAGEGFYGYKADNAWHKIA